MYLKRDDLKLLVDSLSLPERRYFSQYLKSLNHQKVPYYLELFTSMTRGGSPVAQLSPMRSNKAHTNAKSRLYKQIMQCLRNYHQENSIELIVQNLFCEIEILYDRGLPEQSLVLLRKVHEQALLHENYGLMLQVLVWERKLNIILDVPTRANNEIAMEEKRILENFNQIIELENIYSKAIEIKKRNGYVKGKARKELDKITLNNPFLSSENKPASKRGKYYYHFIHSLYYWLTLDHKQAYSYSQKLLNPELQQIAPNEYLEGILQHVTSCMGLGYFDETLSGLELADAFVMQKRFNHATSYSIRVFYFRSCYKLIMYTYMGQIDDLLATIKDTEAQILLYDGLLSLEMKLVIYGNLRNAYIASDDMDKAGHLLELLLYKESKHVRSDVYNDLFLSRIFSYLANRTYVLVPTMALAAYRQYKQTEKVPLQLEVGIKIASILMKDYNYIDPFMLKGVLEKIKGVLQEHISSIKGLNNFQEIYTFYLIWTESMLLDQPFHVSAVEWYRQNFSKR